MGVGAVKIAELMGVLLWVGFSGAKRLITTDLGVGAISTPACKHFISYMYLDIDKPMKRSVDCSQKR